MKKICEKCATPQALSDIVHKDGTIGTCDYCQKSTQKVIKNTKLFSFILNKISINTVKLEDLTDFEQVMTIECGSDTPHLMDIWTVLSDFMEIDCDEFAEDFVSWSPELELKKGTKIDQLYAANDGYLESNPYDEKWEDFTHDIIHRNRFFNENAERFLDELFDISFFGDESGKPYFTELPERSMIYKARIVNSRKERERIKENCLEELGPVPSHLATEQRMTPSGISTLYCAFDKRTCLSELRPVSGDVAVSVAYRTTKPLTFLDLSKFENAPAPTTHPLDENYHSLMNSYAFLKRLIFKLAKPKTSTDRTTYLPTQITFEFIRKRFRDYATGIIFPSTQRGLESNNIVFFPEKLSISEGRNRIHLGLRHTRKVPPSVNTTLEILTDTVTFHAISSVAVESIDFENSYQLDIAPGMANRIGPRHKVLKLRD